MLSECGYERRTIKKRSNDNIKHTNHSFLLASWRMTLIWKIKNCHVWWFTAIHLPKTHSSAHYLLFTLFHSSVVDLEVSITITEGQNVDTVCANGLSVNTVTKYLTLKWQMPFDTIHSFLLKCIGTRLWNLKARWHKYIPVCHQEDVKVVWKICSWRNNSVTQIIDCPLVAVAYYSQHRVTTFFIQFHENNRINNIVIPKKSNALHIV